MKKLTTREFATVKRVAQSVNPFIVKRDKAIAKINELQDEIHEIQGVIDGFEGGIISLTGGYTSEDLVIKSVETTDKMDAKGNPIKVTKYIPSSMVKYSEEDNCYYIEDAQDSSDSFADLDEMTIDPDVEGNL